MRLYRLRLVNYIGIYHGMGLHEIDINFSLCKHNLLVIKGDNGSGKSTIYNAMNPLNDNTDSLIEGLEGLKLISYLLDDGTILQITYRYPVSKKGERKLTKCSIIRIYPDGNSVELNSSGNINSGKDIIYEFFDLDDNFILLSQLSANKKGLGGLKPFDRKKYVNTIIDSLEEYNSLYRLLTKKSIALKSMINSISTKLSQIGNVEMVKDIITKNTQELNILEEKKNYLISSTASMKAKLDEINKDGNIIDIYNESLKRRNELMNQYNEIPKEIQDYSEEELLSLEKQDSKYEATISILENNLQSLLDKEVSIRDDRDKLQIQLNSLFDQELLESTKNKINDLKIKLKFYEDCFESVGFKEYENISEQEYNLAINAIDNINTHILSLGDVYSLSIIEKSCSIIVNPNSMRSLESINNELHIMKDRYDSLIKELNNSISQELFDNSDIKCDHMNECPAIKILLNKKFIPAEKYKYIKNNIQFIGDYIKELEKERDELSLIYKCKDEIKSLINYIETVYKVICKFPGTDRLSSMKSIISSIESILPINIDLSKYREYMNYITAISSTKKDIESMQNKLDEMMYANTASISIKQKLELLVANLQEVMDSKSTLLAQISNTKNEELQIKSKLQNIRLIKANKTAYESISLELKEINEKTDYLAKKVDEFKSINEKYIEDSSILNSISMNDIPGLSKVIEENKYKMVLFDQYKKDYDEYSKLYDSVQQVRHYSSINGIQTKYMTVYMNDILKETNDLLELLFYGSFKLQPFVINEVEFRIPCIDMEGNIRPDISLMSDSQVSMISMLISFSLLHKASKYYNIIKLDEVDSNLDVANRMQFSVLINDIMNMLHFNQCIIISHNNELDLSNVDMIIFKIQNEETRRSLYDSGANIIYDYSINA